MYFLQIDKFIHLDWGNWKHYRSKSKYSSLQVGTIVMKLVFCHGSYFFILFVFKLMPVEGSCCIYSPRFPRDALKFDELAYF
jgi:hypothetical protein